MPPALAIVVDTNVIISRMLAARSPAGRAFSLIQATREILFSLDTWHELSTVAAKPKFSRYLPYEMHMAFLRVLQPKEFVPITTHVTVCRDATDNKFLELAIDGKADMIVSGDQDLLVMGSFQGIAIHDPATYLRLNLY